MMLYEESWPQVVSVSELRRELGRHGFTLEDWWEDNPPLPMYRSVDVLAWLGY